MESSVPLIKKELTFVFWQRTWSFRSQPNADSRRIQGGEKLDETEENLLEHRTDGTDAFDTLYIGAEKFPYREMFPVSASGVL